MDYTSIHSSSKNKSHLVDLHLWRGAPINKDETRPIEILINQGYVVGFSPDRLQPIWSAYRVAHADADVKYDRPLTYYDDMRLDKQHRIGKKTFGKIGGIRLNVGHMTPNEVINRQFGRLAQMETFFMSNMSPQYASLNQGVWLKLETAIREIKDEKGKDHVWTIVGPIFSDEPSSINRGRNKYLPVPEAYFCVIVDPFMYPFDTLSKVHLDCFIIPQNAPRDSNPEDYPATLIEIEELTNLEFFPSWGREISSNLLFQKEVKSASRIMKILNENSETSNFKTKAENELEDVNTIDQLIGILKDDAEQINVKSELLSVEEKSKLKAIQHTISWLHKAEKITCSNNEQNTPSEKNSNFITYKIINDIGNKLKLAARTSCNFWNRFILPEFSIVIRLGTFTSAGNTIARAYKPYDKNGVRYSRVEFNTRFLGQFSNNEIVSTIIHEIGHSLGIGWDNWRELFHHKTGKFKRSSVRKLKKLEDMEIELTGGDGTALAHWDEKIFDKELMTGYKDVGEYVLPVTIDIMKLLGHSINEKLDTRTELNILIQESENIVFSRQDEVKSLNLEYFEETEVFETIPHTNQETT